MRMMMMDKIHRSGDGRVYGLFVFVDAVIIMRMRGSTRVEEQTYNK